MSHTHSFVRWVDDFRIFFPAIHEANAFLHDFTKYLYEVHRLVLSGEKTRIHRVTDFTRRKFRDDEETERLKRQAKVVEVALAEYLDELYERAGPYSSPEEEFDEEEYAKLRKQLFESNRIDILAGTYTEILSEQLKRNLPDFVLLRRVFKNAARYRIRAILKTTFEHLDRLLPRWSSSSGWKLRNIGAGLMDQPCSQRWSPVSNLSMERIHKNKLLSCYKPRVRLLPVHNF